MFEVQHILFACTACMGAPGDDQTNGMNAAILFLLGVVGIVLTSIMAGAVYVAWRGSRSEDSWTS